MLGFFHRLVTALVVAVVAPPAAQAQRAAEPLPPPENGIASVYSGDLEGQLTASGRRYDGNRLTAAHRTLPFGTRVRVTDPASGKTVRVTVIDRWGGGGGRVINLSRAAAEELGIGAFGQLTVRIEVERLGDGEVEEPEEPGVVREPLAPRLESTANDPSGRHAQCSNEAEILGLRDQWRDMHVRNCMARKRAAGGR